MSDPDSAGFGKFVPGFDFLQNLAKGASANVPQMPSLGSWVAPTLNVEELDKRIEELKNVQFWLEQNSRALSATIQALEVQKMTLATLKGMNFNLGDIAKAFTPKAATTDTAPKAAEAAKPEPVAEAADAPGKPATPAAALVDPMQLWGALTTQFQQIAATALQEVTSKASAGLAKGASAAGKASAASKASPKPAAKAAPAKKPAAKTARK